MKDSRFVIFCFDGGGVRGAFAAGFAARLEELMTKTLGHDWRIGECADLLGGTSTGGLVAAALAFRIPAAEIDKLYQSKANEIFVVNRLGWNPFKVVAAWVASKVLRMSPRQMFRAKYLPDGLSALLKTTFEKYNDGSVPLLGEAKNRLVLPSVNLTQGRTTVFKTSNWRGLVRDRELSIIDVLLATAAAPTYFPVHGIKRVGATTDGGLWANHPGMVCLVEALRIGTERTADEGEPISIGDIHLISVGTGRTAPGPAIQVGSEAGGVFAWAKHLLETIFSAQSQGTDFQLRHLLQDRYHRINFSFPPGDRPWELDDPSHVKQLGDMGRHEAEVFFDTFRNQYGVRKATKFEPAEALGSAVH